MITNELAIHVILGVDNTCDKVFNDIEQRVDMNNLIETSVGDKNFFRFSVHTLRENAISKLLSSSYAAHGVF